MLSRANESVRGASCASLNTIVDMSRRKKTPRSGKPRPAGTPKMVDLKQFASLEDAFEKVKPGDRYLEVGKVLMPLGEAGMPMTLPTLFWFSMITRSQGLHAAIAREIQEGNPHAAFPLIRAFAESVVLTLYVLDHPRYVQVLIQRASELPKDGPKRKSIQALISYASKHAPGMKDVYADLSEATHFGAVAMWASHNLKGDDTSGYSTTWASSPEWRSDDQALTACAQTLELAEGMEALLRQFAERHVLPLRDAAI